jgi:hypothetical protein
LHTRFSYFVWSNNLSLHFTFDLSVSYVIWLFGCSLVKNKQRNKWFFFIFKYDICLHAKSGDVSN